MKKAIQAVAAHPLISGSAVVFTGSIFSNLFNFLFNLFMSRNLSIVEYGTLASLLSLVALPMYGAGAIVPTVVNFAAIYFSKNDLDALRGLYIRIFKVTSIIGVVIFLSFVLFARNIGNFFHIDDYYLIVIVGGIVLVSFAGTANTAFLQAKLSFKFLTFTNLVSSFSKLAIGVALVFLGYSVGGAISAYLVAVFVAFILSFFNLREIFDRKTKPKPIEVTHLFSYGIPATVALLGLTSLITTDIILVKHFFNDFEAGLYAGMSLVGRVIFFFSAPIATVMFPLVVQKHAKNENYKSLLVLAFLLVLVPSVFLTAIYFLFPEQVLLLFLKKPGYTVLGSLLGIFAIYITVYSLISVMVNYLLSIKKTSVYIPVSVSAVAQILIIWFYHPSLAAIVYISLAISIVLLLYLLVYYKKTEGK